MDEYTNIVNGNARVGVQAHTITGGVHVTGGGETVHITGRQYDTDGSYFMCRFCRPTEGGTEGWTITNGVTTHDKCGRVQ